MSRLLILTTVLVLSACSNTVVPAVNYYQLGDNERPGLISTSPDARTVVIERVQLAAFLLQSGLVMQHGVNQLQVSRQHLWAQSLDLALPRSLQIAMQDKTEDYRIYLQASDFVPAADFGLRMQIDSFQLTDTGQALSAGSYQLVNKLTNSELGKRNFKLSQDLTQDGYPHGVTQLSNLIESIATLILTDLATL